MTSIAPRAGASQPPRSVAPRKGNRLLGLLRATDHRTIARRARLAAFVPLIDGSRREIRLQPIVDLATAATVGYEALSRFTDVTGVARCPEDVFAQATELGLGVRLEQAAAVAALAVLPDLPPGSYLSVNFSPRALLEPATADLLLSGPTGQLTDRIVVEVTEHEEVRDYAALLAVLNRLRGHGIRLAIDDTGAGFASLQHVTRLAPDIIKLDSAFVRDIDRDLGRRAVARALIGCATETGAVLVAEGIETSAEADQLRALGAQLGQGYHLGRPRPPAALMSLSLTP
jgi:EAL domain-containing protein (putative c-di-GMP-specific phosphodiesterase class I)